jgi:hypothetical protein
MKRLATLALLLAFATACGDSTTSPAAMTAETFSGTLAPGSQSVQTFTDTAAGTVTITATSLNPQATVGVGIGTLNGAACATTAQSSVQQGGTFEAAEGSSGTYCAVLSDVAGLTTPVSYTISVEHP